MESDGARLDAQSRAASGVVASRSSELRHVTLSWTAAARVFIGFGRCPFAIADCVVLRWAFGLTFGVGLT
jgi:hypothetical protein